MTTPPSQRMQQGALRTQKQTQHLMMTRQMQQALSLLQMPVQELFAAIDAEIEQNPILEYFEEESEEIPLEKKDEESIEFNEEDFEIFKHLDEEFTDHFAQDTSCYQMNSQEDKKLKSYLESTICDTPSLYHLLLQQAKETFDTRQQMQVAEVIIGNLNDAGYLIASLEEIALVAKEPLSVVEAILYEIQKFDPPGIAARTLSECLLLQLKGKENTLAYRLIHEHFDDVIHNRLNKVVAKLKCPVEEISLAIKTLIAPLDLHPGLTADLTKTQGIVPDGEIYLDEGELHVEVDESPFPPLRFNRLYLKLLEDPNTDEETKEYVKEKITSARWLLKNIGERNSTIKKILLLLAEKQKTFLTTVRGDLNPLLMKEAAKELDVHESTIARTVANKYIQTPRGLLPLRSFFINSLPCTKGKEVSTQSVREKIKALIDGERRSKPLSDQTIAEALHKLGIECARRTVAKYRAQLGFGNTQQRRRY